MSHRSGSILRGAAPAAALLASCLAAPARAERNPENGAPDPPHRHHVPPSPLTDRFYIEGIFYTYGINTTLRLNPSGATAAANPGLVGTRLSGENDLGLLSRQYQGRVEAMMRIRGRSKLRLDFEQVERSAAPFLSSPIQLGNISLPAGTQLDNQLHFRMTTLTYTYSVYRSDELEVGVGGALHGLEVRALGVAPALMEHQDDSVAAFFPTVALDVAWRFARRFAFTARAQYLNAAVGGFTGSLLMIHSDVQYRWNKAFAVGVGYTLEHIDTQLSTAQDEFSLHMRGPEAFFRVAF